jgi:integrase
MGRPRIFPPKVHQNQGQDRVYWNGKWHYLGASGSAEAKAEYGRLLALWAVDPNAVPMRSDEYLVSELCADFIESDQAPRDKRQRDIAIRAVELLLEHHLRTPVSDFGPLALSSWQSWLCRQVYPIQHLKAGKQRWNRTYIGHLVRVIRSIWKWGVASERIGEDRYRALLTVPGPRFGECREPVEVAAADPTAVEKVLARLSGPVRAMLLLQRSSGARPGELCAMRPCDVHRSGKVRLPWTGAMFDCDAEKVWLYIPSKHKGTSRRKLRAIYFARQAQEILRPFLDRDPETLCFSPREAVQEQRAAQRAARIAAGGGSGGNRKKPAAAPGRPPSNEYSPRSYYIAIQRACQAAGVEPFTPYSVRHLVGQEVDHDFGLDAARDVLGHSDPRTTTRYAKANSKRAAEVARKRGE